MREQVVALDELCLDNLILRAGQFAKVRYVESRSKEKRARIGPVMKLYKNHADRSDDIYFTVVLYDVQEQKLKQVNFRPQFLQAESFRSVVIVGGTASGKTCYLTTLIHHIQEQGGRSYRQEMTVSFHGDGSRVYRELHKLLYVDGIIPPVTSRLDLLPCTLKFPKRNWFGEKMQEVSVLIPDAPGQAFEKLDDPLRTCVECADALVLLVDPDAQKAGRPQLANWVLGKLVETLAERTAQEKGKFQKLLAVVITKTDVCDPDEYGLFGPVNRKCRWPPQGRNYKDKITGQISTEVCRRLDTEEWLDLVPLARNHFQHVCYFAGSALGQSPENGRLTQPIVSRRVEDPLLWILRTWNYL